jgi:hypothetical protein
VESTGYGHNQDIITQNYGNNDNTVLLENYCTLFRNAGASCREFNRATITQNHENI